MKKEYYSPEFDITVINFEKIMDDAGEGIDPVSNPEYTVPTQFIETDY